MGKAPAHLKKLAAGRTLFALFVSKSQTLWLADDHLLAQTRTGYTEQARRFYFADIQSIVYARTHAGTVLSVVWTVAAILFMLAGLALVTPAGMTTGAVVAALALIPLAGLAFNLVAGPTCACFICTEVQSETVTALNRIHKVERVLGQILPRIDAAQGGMTPDMLGLDNPGAVLVEAGRHIAGGGPARVGLRSESGRFHRVAFSLCLVMALTIAGDIFVHSTVKDGLDMLLVLALLSFTVISLAAQAGSDVPHAVKLLTYALLVMVPGYLVLGVVFGLTLGLLSGDLQNSNLAVMSSAPYQVFQVISVSAFSLVGVFGWIRLHRAGKGVS